jgi:hypothetical protein
MHASNPYAMQKAGMKNPGALKKSGENSMIPAMRRRIISAPMIQQMAAPIIRTVFMLVIGFLRPSHWSYRSFRRFQPAEHFPRL